MQDMYKSTREIVDNANRQLRYFKMSSKTKMLGRNTLRGLWKKVGPTSPMFSLYAGLLAMAILVMVSVIYAGYNYSRFASMRDKVESHEDMLISYEQFKTALEILEARDFEAYYGSKSVVDKISFVTSGPTYYDSDILTEFMWHGLYMYVPSDSTQYALSLDKESLTVTAYNSNIVAKLIETDEELTEYLDNELIEIQDMTESYEVILEKIEPQRAFIQYKFKCDGINMMGYGVAMTLTNDVLLFIQYITSEHASLDEFTTMKTCLQTNVIPRFN